ncbi:MAG: DUF2703 domain-containing protein [Marinobacter sp.]|nr:DUF2703 domain-containing protein [Marinobacter sp.]
MKALTIRWQRLVDEKGRTCDRCAATESGVEAAVDKLKRALGELDIDVVLEKNTVDPATFNKDPMQSNRIWIGDRLLEDWLAATTGQSQCCSTCGEADCRTVTVGGKTYEAIPSQLILKAGLMAGAQLLDPQFPEGYGPAVCAPEGKGGCCPPSSGAG